MKSLLSYIFESNNPISDDAILYKIGKYKFNANQTIRSNGSNALQNAIKKYNIDRNNPRAGLIRWAKDVTPRLLPDDEEIIHRKYWSLSTLNGETEKQLMHLDYWTINQYILKNYKPKHDILTIFECSTSKPYASNSIIKNNFLNKFGVFTDFACISNPGIIPMDYSQFYPYRFDEWDHGAESNDISTKYATINKFRFINYVKKLGYKHVLVLIQNPHTQLCFDEAWKENTANCHDWLHIISDSNFRKKLGEKCLSKFNNNWGLVIQRTMTQPYTRDLYMRALKSLLNNDDKIKFNELSQLIKDKDIDAIKEWNEKHGWKPIDYLHGIKNASFKRMTLENSVDKSLVDDYKKFIQDEIKSIVEHSKETVEDKFYENNIYNTVLDWLLKFYKDKTIEDPDTYYWNMKKALDETSELTCFSEYCYSINDLMSKYNIKQNLLLKEANKLKLIQLSLKQQKADFKKIK